MVFLKVYSIKNKFPSLFQYFDDRALKLLRKGVFPFLMIIWMKIGKIIKRKRITRY